MLLESGRKLGLTASLIAVIVPVITVILYVLSFLSLFGLISKTFQGSPFFGFPFFSGLSIAFLALGLIGFVGIILFISCYA